MSASNFTDMVNEIHLAGIVERNSLKNIVHKFAKADIGTTLETCWNGAGNYPFPSVGSVLSVVSTSLNDTAGGTGARTIEIVGLDENFIHAEEILTMNGTTPVLTVGQFARITTVTLKKVGSGEAVAGTINLTHVTDANIIAIVGVKGRTQQAVYTIPADKIGLLMRADATVGKNKLITIELYQRDWDTVDLEYDGFSVRHISDVFEGNYTLDIKIPLPIPSRADIDMRSISDVASTEVAISFDIFLIDAT